jgi:hypothetical protein
MTYIQDGKIIGTDVSVVGVATHYFYRDTTPERLAVIFKLSMAQVYAVLGHFHENFDAIRQQIWDSMSECDRQIAEWREQGKLITFNYEWDETLSDLSILDKSLDVTFYRPTQDEWQGKGRNLFGSKHYEGWNCTLAMPLYDKYSASFLDGFDLPDRSENPAFSGSDFRVTTDEDYSKLDFIVFEGSGDSLEEAFRYAQNAYTHFLQYRISTYQSVYSLRPRQTASGLP